MNDIVTSHKLWENDETLKNSPVSETTDTTVSDVDTIISYKDLLYRTFFKTIYVWPRKTAIRDVFLWKSWSEIDYVKLRPMIWQWWIDTVNSFIEEHWEELFLEIMREITD